MQKERKARIIATGSYVPEKVLTNLDLEKMVETSDEWITTRTGMKERRLARDDEFPSTMGAEAAKKALQNAGVSPEEVDLVLVATMTPDYLSPSTAGIVQHLIGARSAAAFDFQAACSGFPYGLSMAKAYVEAGIYRHVLLVAAEKMSAFVDYEDRATCILFGDGAAAALISDRGAGFSLDSIKLGADGSEHELLSIPAGGAREQASQETLSAKRHYVHMNGREIYRHGIRRMEEVARASLAASELEIDQVDWLIPHQANRRMIEALCDKLGLPMERVHLTLEKYGNTSAASMGIALDDLQQEHTIAEGEHLLMVAFGGGLTWAATTMTKVGA